MRGSVALMVAAVSCSACAAARPSLDEANQAASQIVPTAWSSEPRAHETPLTSHFLDLIHDARLQDLVTEALDGNHDLLASARRLDAASWELTETSSLRWPSISAEVRRARTEFVFDPTPITEHRAVVVGSWDLDLWGRLAKLEDEGTLRLAGLAVDLEAARDALGARVVQAWVEAVSIRRAINAEAQRVAVLQRLEETIRRRYRAGLGTLDDLSAARSSADVARAGVVALEADLGDVQRRLEVLVGRRPTGTLTPPAVWPAIAPVESGLPVEAVLARADVRASMLRLEASDAAAAAAVRARLPSLRISADGGPRGGPSLGDVLSGRFAWGLVTSITQPIFQGGLLRARSEARRSEFEAAWHDYMSVVSNAVVEVEDALSRERALLRQRTLVERAASEAGRQVDVQTRRYRLGLADVLDLLSVRNQQLDLQRQVIALDGTVLSNRIALALAVGAAFTPSTS